METAEPKTAKALILLGLSHFGEGEVIKIMDVLNIYCCNLFHNLHNCLAIR